MICDVCGQDKRDVKKHTVASTVVRRLCGGCFKSELEQAYVRALAAIEQAEKAGV